MIKKNTAITGFPFVILSVVDGSAITSGTVSGYVTIDGGTQTALTNTPIHEGNGQWSVDLTAGELNGAIIGLVFSHPTGITQHFTLPTTVRTIDDISDASNRVDVGSWLGTAVTVSATSAKPEVDVYSVSDDATAANNCELFFDGTGYNAANSTVGEVSYANITRSGTAQAGGASTITLDAAASAVDEYYQGDIVYITGGTGASQSRQISSYVGATKIATVEPAWGTAPDVTSTFKLIAGSQANVTVTGTVDCNLTQVLGTAVTETTAGNVAGNISTIYDNADVLTTLTADTIATAANTIVAYGLDHLVSTSVTGTDIANDSIIASLVSASATADWDTFTNTTDSLEAIGSKTSLITTESVAVVSPILSDGTIVIHRGASNYIAQGNEIRFTIPATTQDLSAAGLTVRIGFSRQALATVSGGDLATAQFTGTIVDAGLSTQYVYFEFSDANTSSLSTDNASALTYPRQDKYKAYQYTVVWNDGTDCGVLAEGYASVKIRYAC